MVRIPTDSAIEGQSLADTGNILARYEDFPRCPPAVRTHTPRSAPADIAAEFWRVELEDKLARPQPRIAPGYMLAGKLGYLETGARMLDRFEHPTALGLLVINTRGQIYVDWGDDSGVSGPYTSPGRAWPDGTITHSWRNAGRYDIVVTQRWTATWDLAGATGTLGGLTTEGRLDDFEVRQLQAVRNR